MYPFWHEGNLQQWEAVDVFGNHSLRGLLEEDAYGKSPKCLGGNLGDFGEFCKGLCLIFTSFLKTWLESMDFSWTKNSVISRLFRTTSTD